MTTLTTPATAVTNTPDQKFVRSMLKRASVIMKTVLSVIAAVMKMKPSVSGAQKILIRESQDSPGQIGTKKGNIDVTMMMTTKKE